MLKVVAGHSIGLCRPISARLEAYLCFNWVSYVRPVYSQNVCLQATYATMASKFVQLQTTGYLYCLAGDYSHFRFVFLCDFARVKMIMFDLMKQDPGTDCATHYSRLHDNHRSLGL